MKMINNLIADASWPRLDRFVNEKCPDISRTFAQKLINEGNITVNGKVAKASLKLDIGDVVSIIVPATSLTPLSPEIIPLTIVYEDDDLMVVDKPAGLTVHPSPGHSGDTLVNAVLAHFPALADMGDSLRPGIVHRLDKDTSGLMLVAKNSTAQDYLINQFKNRSIVKAYQALVKGKLTPESGMIEAALGRDPRNRKRMAILSAGKEARTEYNVIQYIGDYTFLEIKTETGRTHQIRVHLAAIGYPVAGDAVYGVKTPFLVRQFLHACKLGFKLPSTGEYVEFKSELPRDLEQALKEIG